MAITVYGIKNCDTMATACDDQTAGERQVAGGIQPIVSLVVV
jgi:hypothetical protein